MKARRSKAQIKAARRARNERRSQLRVVGSKEIKAQKRKSPEPSTETGLAWLERRGRIDKWRAKAGRLYGVWYSAAMEEGAHPLKSCLATEGMPGGASFTGVTAQTMATMARIADTAHEALAFKLDCEEKLLGARNRLGHESGLIAVCDVICGIGKRPREISDNFREIADMASSVWIATGILMEHFDSTEPGWRRRGF